MTLVLTDTRRGEKVPFEPLEDRRVGMYVCGLTPQDRLHVGHLRTYVAYDLLRRWLEHRGYDVVHVQNITDVEDKLIAKSEETGEDPFAIAERNHRLALEELEVVGCLRPHHLPKVSDHIPAIREMVEALIARGHAYVGEEPEGVEGARSVYFDVASFPAYGELSRTNVAELREGVRKDVAPGKRDPADFALWKAAKPGEPMWDSPWGKGRPGWHIECSVMSRRYLGDRFDIHGGGRDLVFPHHENELAQTEAATGEHPAVSFWTHAGFLSVEGEKMSKSLGNFVTVHDALATWDPMALRLWLVGTHYRSPVDYSEAGLHQARRALERLRNALGNARHALEDARRGGVMEEDEDALEALDHHHAEFEAAMDDDLNTPRALASLQEALTHLNAYAGDDPHRDTLEAMAGILREMLDVLGIQLPEGDDLGDAAPLLDLLLEVREAARARGAYDLADLVRDRLADQGIVVEDTDQGPRWRRA